MAREKALVVTSVISCPDTSRSARKPGRGLCSPRQAERMRKEREGERERVSERVSE